MQNVNSSSLNYILFLLKLQEDGCHTDGSKAILLPLLDHHAVKMGLLLPSAYTVVLRVNNLCVWQSAMVI